MNRKKKIIESYCLLFSDLLCIVIAYAAAILLRYGKFARVQEPEVHALVCVFFLLFCTIYSFLLDWNRSFLERGVLVEFVAVLKFNPFHEKAHQPHHKYVKHRKISPHHTGKSGAPLQHKQYTGRT